jgi:DNA polymerase-3 subunit epsilon
MKHELLGIWKFPRLKTRGVELNFVVADVETANADRSSICQVGIAEFQEGHLSNVWKSLIDPKDYFDPINVSIHGIDEEKVQFAPTWGAIYPEIKSLIDQKIVVSHTAFDRIAMQRACERNGIIMCDCRWLDSARVARRAWFDYSRSGFGLANLASHFGIVYQSHDALEDARCAGEILLRAIADSSLTIDEWLVRVNKPILRSVISEMEPNSEGPLFGEVVVFTGSLSMPRAEAAKLASLVGCKVEDGVTKHSSLLVVGDQDVRKLAGFPKSAKHRKAEALIQRGQQLQILSESDFNQLVLDAAPPMAAGDYCLGAK